MHSRVLGENTEKVREKIELEEMDGDQLISTKGKRSGEKDELFSRSVIAVAHSSSSSEVIHGHILAQGVNCLKINPLGGLLHLITFATMEDKEAMVESQWLLNWFMEIKQVNKSSAAIWRQTTLVIYGVPISAWNYGNFFDIGNIYGRVLSVDYARMDCAKVRIITDCFFLINNPIILDLEDGKFKIFVSEESSIDVNHQKIKVDHDSPQKNDHKDEHDDSSQSDGELQITKSPTVRNSPMHVEELEKSAFDLGEDDNNCLFNDPLGTPNKTAQIFINPLEHQSTQFLTEDPPLPNGTYQCGLSHQTEPGLTSLENIQIFSPPSKAFIPSKLNLEMDTNLNLNLSPL